MVYPVRASLQEGFPSNLETKNDLAGRPLLSQTKYRLVSFAVNSFWAVSPLGSCSLKSISLTLRNYSMNNLTISYDLYKQGAGLPSHR